jgi:hypothetical protein
MARTERYRVREGSLLRSKRIEVRRYGGSDLRMTYRSSDSNGRLAVQTMSGTCLPEPFTFIGTRGYYHDSSERTYVRARGGCTALVNKALADAGFPVKTAYELGDESGWKIDGMPEQPDMK